MDKGPIEFYGKPYAVLNIPDLTNTDCTQIFRLLAASRMFQVELARHRSDVPTPMLLGLCQENAPLAFCHALWEMGGESLLLDSIKSGDHRSLYTIAATMDKLIGSDEMRLDYARNYFVRSTGGYHGFDGNTHWGYLKYRIFPFFSSDMFGTPGFTAGYAAGIRTDEWENDQPVHERPIGFAFFGDGAMQQGLFHEVLNGVAARNCRRPQEEIDKVAQFLDKPSLEAGVFGGIPMIFIVNDNDIACSVTSADEHGNSNLAKRAEGYGNTLGVDVDADDFFSMRKVAWQSIAEAQRLRSVLVRARTFRGTAHNQDFTGYKDNALTEGDFSAVDYLFGHDDAYVQMFKEKWAEDPFVKYGEWLVSGGRASRQELEEIREEEAAEAKQIIETALSEPIVVVTGLESKRPIFKSFDWSGFPLEKPENESFATKKMGYLEAFRWIVEELMREKDAFYMGEDVYFGGVLGLTKGLNKKFGPAQLIDMPISEEWIVNLALGLGLYGKTALCEFEFAHFIWDALRSFRIVSPQFFQKDLEFDCTGIAPFGPVNLGMGNGEYHESDITRYVQSLAGVIIFAPSNAYDMVGLMRAAGLYRGPKICLYQISAGKAKKEFSSDVPVEQFVIPFGKAKVVCGGSDVTVVTYGAACVSAAIHEAKVLAKEGVSVEVIDLRTVYPCDFETILKSLKKTRRLVIMHEDFGMGGISAYITSELYTQFDAHALLREKPRHVVAKYPFIPSAPELAYDRLPYERDAGNNNIHCSSELKNTIKAMVISDTTVVRDIGKDTPEIDFLSGVGEVIEMPTSSRRKEVARLMEESEKIPAYGDMFMNVDITLVHQTREKYKKKFKKDGITLRYDHFVMHHILELLSRDEFADLNGYWDAAKQKKIRLKHINIGFAMNAKGKRDGEEYLIVPVVHEAENLSLRDITRLVEKQIKKARSSTLTVEDCRNLSFTVNNTGRLGGDVPHSVVPSTRDSSGNIRPTGMIVSFTKIVRRGKKYYTNLAFRFDHRLCDGALPSRFIQELAHSLSHRRCGVE